MHVSTQTVRFWKRIFLRMSTWLAAVSWWVQWVITVSWSVWWATVVSSWAWWIIMVPWWTPWITTVCWWARLAITVSWWMQWHIISSQSVKNREKSRFYKLKCALLTIGTAFLRKNAVSNAQVTHINAYFSVK